MRSALQIVLVESRDRGAEAVMRAYAAARCPGAMRIAGGPAEAWRAMLAAIAEPEPALFAASLDPAGVGASEVLERVAADPAVALVPVLVESGMPLAPDAMPPIARGQLAIAIAGVERWLARRRDGPQPDVRAMP